MSAPVLRFARVVANQVHECAPDHAVHSMVVGDLREAVAEMTELYEALGGLLAEANRIAGGITWHFSDQPVAKRAAAALAKARGEQ